MAYGNYFPQNYYQAPQPYYGMGQNQSQMVQNSLPNSNNGITWVQGEASAKSFPVGAGQSVLLMDSEDSVMYIKSTDQSGMPQPLRIFDYVERTTQHSESGIAKNINTEEFVSRKEFDEFREDVKRTIKGIRKPRIAEEE